MSSTEARQPPRFVPTLTDVVHEQQIPAAHHAATGATDPSMELPPVASVAVDVAGGQSSRELPVEPFPVRLPVTPAQITTGRSDWAALAHDTQAKVMARLDVDLEERLRYALADIVQLHTQSMYQAIRQEVQSLVTEAVHEAIASELQQFKRT